MCPGEGYQMRVIGRLFIIWFNPTTGEFTTTDRKRK
jgi:hypothetical protein